MPENTKQQYKSVLKSTSLIGGSAFINIEDKQQATSNKQQATSNKQQATSNKQQKILPLQGIRGFAFLLIFISHCKYFTNSFNENIFNNLGGWGVSLFLILSGYLAARFYKYKPNESNKFLFTKGFEKLKKRLRRVYPLHFITLLLSLPFAYKTLFINPDWKQWFLFVINSLLLQSWIPKEYFSFNGVSWYLSVFLFITVITPFCCNWFYKVNTKESRFENSLIISVSIIAIQFFWCWFWKDYSFAHWIIYIHPIVRSLDFILGINLFFLAGNHINSSTPIYTNIGIIIGMFITYLSLDTKSEFFVVSMWSLPSSLLILGTITILEQPILILKSKITLLLGELSLEMFLTHQLIIRYSQIINNKFTIFTDSIFVFVSAFLLTLLVSFTIHLVCIKQTCQHKVN